MISKVLTEPICNLKHTSFWQFAWELMFAKTKMPELGTTAQLCYQLLVKSHQILIAKSQVALVYCKSANPKVKIFR